MMLSNKSKTKQTHKFSFDALGTGWTIESNTRLSSVLQDSIRYRLEEYDHTYSRFRADSAVSQLSIPGTYHFPEDFNRLFQIYKTCFEHTDGQMTPLIGSMLEDAGYDMAYSFKAKEIQPIPDFLQTIKWDGLNTLISSKPVTFDVGAAGKGYAVDIIAQLIEHEGVSEYIIDASGDIKHHMFSTESIGLEHPDDPSKVIGVANIDHESLCASASNRRKWRDFHHIVNPATQRPVDHITATWVVADDTLTADAMATALFFVESPNRLMEVFSFSYVRMYADGTVERSMNFKGELFT